MVSKSCRGPKVVSRFRCRIRCEQATLHPHRITRRDRDPPPLNQPDEPQSNRNRAYPQATGHSDRRLPCAGETGRSSAPRNAFGYVASVMPISARGLFFGRYHVPKMTSQTMVVLPKLQRRGSGIACVVPAVGFRAADQIVEPSVAQPHIAVLKEAVDRVEQEVPGDYLRRHSEQQEWHSVERKMQCLFERMKTARCSAHTGFRANGALRAAARAAGKRWHARCSQ